MKSFRRVVLWALILCISGGFLVIYPLIRRGWVPPFMDNVPPAERQARMQFSAKMDALRNAKDYEAIQKAAKAWQAKHPDDPNGYSMEGTAQLYLGDLPGCEKNWELSGRLDSAYADAAKLWIPIAKTAGSHASGQALARPRVVASDLERPRSRWFALGAKLLANKQYDEIDAVASQLTKNPQILPNGYWTLDYFAQGLSDVPGEPSTEADWADQHQMIQDWKIARPNSILAKAVSVHSWVNGAWAVRGEGYSNTITPTQSAKMDRYLAAAETELNAARPLYRRSPIFYSAWLQWAFLDGNAARNAEPIFQEGIKTYPTHWELYCLRAYMMVDRWYGDPGDWENLAANWADAIGGVEGDKLYARIVWNEQSLLGFDDTWRTTAASWPRTKSGMRALLKQYPNSLVVATRLAHFAMYAKDYTLARKMHQDIIRGQVDSKFWKDAGTFAESRLWLFRQS